MHFVSLVAALPLAGAIPQRRATNNTNFTVTILADSNRDGKVDITGDTDLVGKEKWTEESGALFLANIVDTDRRCSSQITGSCANKLADMFFLGSPLPEKPVLDPKIEQSMPLWGIEEWLDGLSESDKTTYTEWEKKHKEYSDMYWEARDVDTHISLCHDASDDILRNANHLAPLRTLPSPGLSNSATGSVAVSDETAASNVRLFHKNGGQWAFVGRNYTFEAQQLKAGLELGIDGRDVRRPDGWDGRATVEFKVKDGANEAKDSVVLRVAPVLTQHHGQPAKQLLTATGYGGDDQQRFIKEIGEISGRAGVTTPLHVFDTSRCSQRDEIWAQDFFEPGYMSIPGPEGPVSIHIMIRSAQTYRDSGRKVFQDLRSDTVGAVQHLANGVTIDSTGNLETVPPYRHNGKSYAAGRAVMGSSGGKPHMMAFLEAQETQAPIELDTSWLAVQHTDEFMQFLPVQSERGWVMMVDDPRAGLEMLQNAQQAGHGQEMAVSRPKSPTDHGEWRVTNTIDELLNMTNFAGFQESCAKSIDVNIDIIKRETGITDADIIRIPSLYEVYRSDPWKYAGDKPLTDKELQDLFSQLWPAEDGKQRRQMHEQARAPEQEGLDALEAGTPPRDLKPKPENNATASSLEARQETGTGPAVSLYPGTINSVVLNNKQILAPNPWGPVIDGQDVLATAVNAAYAKAGYTVAYVDDWFTHHKKVGEVHCGSNVIRELTDVKWW